MQGELVGEVAALGHLDRVDLADEVGDRGVGGGQLLAEAVVAVDPVDGSGIAHLGHQVAGVFARRVVGVVVDFAAGDDRHPLVEQAGETADDAGLGLATLTEEDHVVPSQEGVLQLGHHRVLVAQHPCEQGLTGGDAGHRIAADLLLHRHGLPARRLQLRQVRCTVHHARTLSAAHLSTASAASTVHPMELSGRWVACVADDEVRRSAVGLDHDDSAWTEVAVPGHWRLHPRVRRQRRPADVPPPLPPPPTRRRRAPLHHSRRHPLPGRRVARRRLPGRPRGLLLPPHLRHHRACPAGRATMCSPSRWPAHPNASAPPSATSPAPFSTRT